MAVESAADRAAFTSTSDFGVTVTWTVAGGMPAEVAAIAETGSVLAERGEGPAVQSQNGMLIIADADLPAGAAEGDAVSFNSVTYLVRAVLPDGTGFTEVQLEIDRS